MIYLAIASDGYLNEAEWKFIASFIGGVSYNDALDECRNILSEQNKEGLANIVHSSPRHVAEALVSMCIGVLCTDGRVEGEEIDFLRKLL